jgi:hypothetical protein
MKNILTFADFISKSKVGIRWKEIDKNGEIIIKEKEFNTQSQFESFLKNLQDKENFIEVEAYLNEDVIYKNINDTTKKLFKAITNPAEYGDDIKLHVYMDGNTMVYIDTFFYGEKQAKESLIKSWSPGGYWYEHFKKEYGWDIHIVDSFSEIFATGRHKKLSKNGIVGVKLIVK